MINSCTDGKTSDSCVAWHVLYHAALFETDRDQLPRRIAEAESAILARIRELFAVATDHIEEDVVLDDALYALRALRTCVLPESNAAQRITTLDISREYFGRC
jgi:hypothetical protein